MSNITSTDSGLGAGAGAGAGLESDAVSMMESTKDFYQILEVSEDASLSEIKKKWLKLSLIYHPDKCGGDNDKFRQINLAYKVLSNPVTRNKYKDSLGKTHDQLKDVHRDLDYQFNHDFMSISSDGQAKFDTEKFMKEFEKTRGHFKELSEIDANQAMDQAPSGIEVSRRLEGLMADRTLDLQSFQSVQQTKLNNDGTTVVKRGFSNQSQLDQFNQVFNQYKKMTSTAIEEVIHGDGGELFASSTLQMSMTPEKSQETINRLAMELSGEDKNNENEKDE